MHGSIRSATNPVNYSSIHLLNHSCFYPPIHQCIVLPSTSICSSIHSFIYLLTHPPTTYPSIYLPMYPPPTWLSVHLSTYPSTIQQLVVGACPDNYKVMSSHKDVTPSSRGAYSQEITSPSPRLYSSKVRSSPASPS